VQQKLTDLQHRNQHGLLCRVEKSTVATYLDHWLANVARPTIAETTCENYAQMVRNHLKPHLGGRRLTSLTPAHVEAMLGRMEEDGHSPRMRQLTFAVLRRALNKAVRSGLLIRNVCHVVDAPRVPIREVEPFSTDQVRQLLAATVDTRYHALFTLAVTTGLRQGELFGLKWSDIDCGKGAITVRRTLIEIRGRFSWGEPKSAQSRRRIEIPAIAVEALEELRANMLAEGHIGAETVFCTREGGLLGKSNFRRRVWLPVLERAGLPRKRFHDLRHTAASILCELGEHPKVIQARLGHSQISMTMNTYSHLMPGMDRQAAHRVGDLLAVGIA
jgi:integrase